MALDVVSIRADQESANTTSAKRNSTPSLVRALRQL